MKFRLFLVLLSVAVVSIAFQVTTYWVPLWNGRSYTFPRLGSSLTVVDGRLEVVFPPVSVPVRVYSSQLTWDGTGYPLPADYKANAVVRRNGLGQKLGWDYDLSGGKVIPKDFSLWDVTNSDVLLDYDKQ